MFRLLIHVALTVFTGGFWLVVLLVHHLIKK